MNDTLFDAGSPLFGGTKFSGKDIEHFDPFGGVFNPDGDAKGRNIRYGIRFCGENFLTPANIISEVIQNSVIFALPNTPNWISGAINLRGNVVSIFDLNAHPDYKTAKMPDTRKLIVIDKDESAIGLFIDNYPVVLDLDGEDVSAVSGSGFASKVVGEYLLGTTKVGESIYYEINYAAFFTELMQAYSK